MFSSGLWHWPGPRTYFVAFLNPAEARAGGGFLSAYAEVRTHDGKISLASVGSTTDLKDLDAPPPGIDTEYQNRYGEYGGDVAWSVTNLSPHFPYDARAWTAMYRVSTGRRVDGVLALDPHAMAVLLATTGPVHLPTGQSISAGNVVSFIERDEYALPVTDQVRKDMLKEVARATFGKLLATRVNATQLTRQLATAAASGHVRFGSTHPDEQARVEAYSVAGVVHDTKQPFAMLAINNASSGKLDTYLDSKLSYVVKECTSLKRSAEITATLTNGAPSRGLPPYATIYEGDMTAHPVPGESESAVSVFLTRGAKVTSARLNGQSLGFTPGPQGSSAPFVDLSTERGHPMASVFIGLKPSQSTTLSLSVSEKVPSRSSLVLMRQPLARPTTLAADVRLCADR